MPRILLVGTFPPPVHGMAAVNQAVLGRLVSEGWMAEKIDTAPPTLSRALLARLSRIPSVIKAWWCLLNLAHIDGNAKAVVYLALAGGWGQLYDLITICISRVKGLRIVIHHHNYLYLNKRKWLTRWVVRAAGRDAGHVALCKDMREALKDCYEAQKVIVFSNLALFPIEEAVVRHPKLRTIGFLSNITHEKGGEIVIALAEAIRDRGLPLKVVVAGPCVDGRLSSSLKTAQAEGVLQWLGAVYGAEKERFWAGIDAFVFPTRNEAEPLVVWEALATGIPLIAYSQGCISEQVADAGVIVPVNKDFVAEALPVLGAWLQDVSCYHAASDAARQRFTNARRQCESDWKALKLLLEGNKNAG